MVIATFSVNYEVPSRMTGTSFNEFMIIVYQIRGSNLDYQMNFSRLIEKWITDQKITNGQFKEYTRFDERLLLDIYNGHIPPKTTVLAICLLLGLDLIQTMLFLINAGYTLNPTSIDIDRQYMIYIDEKRDSKEDMDYRVYNCNEYLKEVHKKCDTNIDCESCKNKNKCQYKKYILGNWKRKKKEVTKKEEIRLSKNINKMIRKEYT